MASVRERRSSTGETTFAVLYRLDGKQSSMTFETAKAASRFKALCDVLGPARALAEQGAAATDEPTLDDLAAKFFDWKRPQVRSDRTVADYERDYANWIKPTLGHRRAASIDEGDVQALVDQMRVAGLSPKSIADRHMVLHSIFKWASARTRRLVPENPCLETELPARQKSAPKGATPAEWTALHAAALKVDPAAADLLLFLVSTGWRWSEATALTGLNVEEYDQDGREEMYVSVTQVWRRNAGHQLVIVEDAKSSAGLRRIKVPGQAAGMIRRRLVGRAPEDLIFTNSAGRKWYQTNFNNRTWPKILAASGITRPVTPHWLRHTHVALLNRTGKTGMAEIQRRLGHESITTTIDVYGRMIDDISTEALDALDALLTDQPAAGQVVSGEVVVGELGRG
jgi:site-specific recombinase XerD